MHRICALLLGTFAALSAAPDAARALAFAPIPLQLVALEHGVSRVSETQLDNTTMYAAFLEFHDQLLFTTDAEPLDFSNGAFSAAGSVEASIENRQLLFEAAVSMTAFPGTFPDWSVFPQMGGIIQGIDLQASLPLLVGASASLQGSVEVSVRVPSIGEASTPLFLSSSNPFLEVSVESLMSGEMTTLTAGSIGFFLPGDELTIRVETTVLALLSSGAESTTCVNRVCELELGADRLAADTRDAFTLQLMAPVPEPGTGALLGLGVVVLARLGRAGSSSQRDR